MVVYNNVLAGAAGVSGGADSYTIEKSLRFNDDDSSFFTRDFVASGDRTKYTFSFWIKFGHKASGDNVIYGHMVSGYQTQTMIRRNNLGYLEFGQYTGSWNFRKITAQTFNDPAAWYHIIWSVDTSLATAEDRIKLYVNGVRVTNWSTNTNPSQNLNTLVNSDLQFGIGKATPVTQHWGKFLLADFHFIDGQALSQDDFGEFDSNNIWQPKEFTGNYRTGVIYSDHTVCNGMTTTSKLNELYNSNTGTCQGINLKGGHKDSLILTYDIPNVTKITIHSNTGSSFSMIVNEGLSDEYSVTVPSQNNVSIADHFTGFTGTLHTLKLYNMSAGVCLNAIAINDVVLVDGPGRNSFRLPFTDLTDLGKDSSFTEPTNKPTQGMEVVTWVGNGGTQSINCGFAPDFVWMKQRNGTGFPMLFNTVEGATKGLHSNNDAAQFTDPATLTGFTSTGFTVGNHSYANSNNQEYAGWCWKGGGTAVTNNAGSVTSTVSANNDYGFSVVKYSLTGSGNETVGTGLNSKVKMLFTKALGSTNGWACWHEAMGDTDGIVLSSSAAKSGVTWWDQSNMTDTAFAHKAGTTSPQGGDVIAYCWSEVPGYSSFGKIYHSSSTQKITFDFKPKFFLIKELDGATDWYIHDLYRDNFDDPLMPNRNIAESSNWAFTVEGNSISWQSGSFYTGNHLYAAFADDPRGNSFEGNNFVGEANQYSSDITGSERSGFPWSAMFNGNKDQGTLPNSGSTFIWAPSPHIEFDELAIYAYKDSSPGTLRINGEDVTSQIPNHNGVGTNQRTVITGITSPLRSIESESNGNTANIVLAGVEINGGLLVDQTTEIDSLRDSPTNYDDGTNIGGNFATLNPLDKSGNAGTYSNGNLDFTRGSGYGTAKSTIGMKSGKWYCEVIRGSGNTVLGVMDESSTPDYLDRQSGGYGYRYDGAKVHNNQGHGNIGGYNATDIVGLGFDADAKTINFYKNGNHQGSFTNVTSTPSDGTWFFAFSAENTTLSVNFGQRPLSHLPTGYKALCTQNFDDPLIGDPSTAFDILTWQGDGSGARTVSGLNLSNAPDLVWSKVRNHGYHNNIFDSVRGYGTSAVGLITDYTGSANGGTLNSATASALTFSGGVWHNQNAKNYVAWAWDGGTTFSNSAGSNGATMASSGTANQSAGISIVNYSYTGTGQHSYVHGLNVKPDLVIRKATNLSEDWSVYHSAMGFDERSYLNGTGSSSGTTTFRSDQGDPTSTLSYINNNNTSNVVEYIFAAVPGFSAFGRYEGNGSTDGPFVYLGFKPAFIMFKNVDGGGDWKIFDEARDPDNIVTQCLSPNSAAAEVFNTGLDFLSNGFKWRDNGSAQNGGNSTHIYAAFASSPFKTARAR